ncbi:fumarylacetoacetase [Gilvimarinus sp. F26214L]|uniref:fumarylacetoacetase n=1 Tax=Gilvimarinus sp. DZF01 TaxID=3461371 RepID=UPI0040457D5A
MHTINETHDPALKSWVESANEPGCDFPIQNLPFAVFRHAESGESWRGGVAIGDRVVDLKRLRAEKLFSGDAAEAVAAASEESLNAFMGLGPEYWSALRIALSRALREGAKEEKALRSCLVPQSQVVFDLPARIGDYTDFYTSIHHATNVGRQFRPDNPLLPNYRWVPIGYHGRSSSIGVSGQSFPRPCGQTRAPDQEVPAFGPSRRMDFELEMGIYIGAGNRPGHPVDIEEAESHIFGLCLLNDWSARDLQAWEYQPLGPFLSKNFASTVSPWIVTLEALAPYRLGFNRGEGEPQPLAYLDSTGNRAAGAIDICLESWIETEKMRGSGAAPVRLSATSFRHSYWTIGQLVTHHTVNGCNLCPGDLLGSGTQSGPRREEAGSMLELSAGGKEPVDLGNGEQRAFLEDGDRVILRGYCEKEGAARIGFGESSGTLLAPVHPAVR